MPYILVVALLVALDQVVKLLVRSMIALGDSSPFIPYIMKLTYIQNTGAAFSALEGNPLLLGILSAVISIILLYVLFKPVIHHPLGKWIVTLILAGAVGNMIDRLFLGYVTDMFQTIFIRFAVFNVADIYVVVGVFALVIYCVLLWDKLEPSDKKAPPAPEEEETT